MNIRVMVPGLKPRMARNIEIKARIDSVEALLPIAQAEAAGLEVVCA